MKKVYYTLLIILFIACSEEDNLPDNMSLPSEEEYETELVNPDYVNIDQETTRLVECDPDKEGIHSPQICLQKKYAREVF